MFNLRDFFNRFFAEKPAPPTATIQYRDRPNPAVDEHGKAKGRDPLIRPGEAHWAPNGNDDFNFKKLEGVRSEPAYACSASITNGYDRSLLLEGPVLALHLQAGETRTIRGPLFHRVPDPARPGSFTIDGLSPVKVLQDMAAESTRAMVRATAEWSVADHLTIGALLERSKFVVREIPQ